MNAGIDGLLKRAMDIVVAGSGLLLGGWVVGLAYLIATLDTKASGMFVQTRIGKDLKTFSIYKLRTMRPVPGMHSNATIRHDPRVTTFGAFLRKSKIDELPQLWNVLNGTMSLVGPRPTVDEDVARMDAQQRRRFRMPPGITGLAQINGNTALPWPQRIEYDLYYVDHFSIWLDIKILLKTLAMVLTLRAETHPSSTDEWDMSASN